jgi:hypothetical protein
MTDVELSNHLSSNVKRILEKWKPTMTLFRLWNEYTDDNLTEVLSKYCEWWEVRKPNYDGLGEILEKICKKLTTEKKNIEDYEYLVSVFGEDFSKVYNLQQFRESQIKKLYETNRR